MITAKVRYRAKTGRHFFAKAERDCLACGARLRAKAWELLPPTVGATVRTALYWDKDGCQDVICTREGTDPDRLDVEGVTQWIDEFVPTAACHDLAAAFLAKLEAP